MDTDLVEEGALTWVVVDVSLIESVHAAHVVLEGESRAVATDAVVLREDVPLNDSTHGHVGPVLD